MNKITVGEDGTPYGIGENPASQYKIHKGAEDKATGQVECPNCSASANVLDYNHSGADELYRIHFYCWSCNSGGVIKTDKLPEGLGRDYQAYLSTSMIKIPVND